MTAQQKTKLSLGNASDYNYLTMVTTSDTP